MNCVLQQQIISLRLIPARGEIIRTFRSILTLINIGLFAHITGNSIEGDIVTSQEALST